MLVHDLRVQGRSPDKLADYVYEVDANVPIQQMIDMVHDYASSQSGLQNLYIICHGVMADWNLGDQSSTGFQVGGFGLRLCSEGISLGNVNLMAALKDDIATITIFACAAADVGPGNQNTGADGMKFCGEMALHTHATVIAAVQAQVYSDDRTFWDWLSGRQGQIDMGTWEGPVYSFSPNDGTATAIKAPAQNAMSDQS
jgi:hypothetical protein